MIWRTDLMIRWFGRIPWAEDKLGGGGTWLFHKILGIIIIIAAFLVMSGDATFALDLLIPTV